MNTHHITYHHIEYHNITSHHVTSYHIITYHNITYHKLKIKSWKSKVGSQNLTFFHFSKITSGIFVWPPGGQNKNQICRSRVRPGQKIRSNIFLSKNVQNAGFVLAGRPHSGQFWPVSARLLGQLVSTGVDGC